MTNKQFEQIEYLSKKLWGDINNGHEYSMVTYSEFLGIVTEVWEELQEEPVSEDLEEAIDTYLKSYWDGEKERQEWPFLKKMVIYFVKWQKEKMMTKAIDGKVLANGMGNPILHLWDKGRHLIDKKVKVIVINED